MNKPRALKKGCTIGLVGPASPGADPESLDKAAGFIEGLGFNVKPGRAARDRYGYLAGRDADRAGDIHEMFADRAVDGIFCLRGGYGTPRLARMLDMAVIRRNPKVFLGYSDITTLLIQFSQMADLITFHGPMPVSDMIRDDFSACSLESLMSALTGTAPRVLRNPAADAVCLYPGVATAPITGGNLTLIGLTMGTPYEIDTRGKLLLIEDIDEEPYRTDGRLCQLRNAGKFEDCAGFIIGSFNGSFKGSPESLPPADKTLTMEQIIEDLILPAGKPVLSNFSAGHCEPNLTIPFGIPATLDAAAGTLSFGEGFVE